MIRIQYDWEILVEINKIGFLFDMGNYRFNFVLLTNAFFFNLYNVVSFVVKMDFFNLYNVESFIVKMDFFFS